jgi:anti-sigma factor RsiW
MESAQTNFEMNGRHARNEHFCEEDMELYLTGRLLHKKASALEAHLGNCKRCAVGLNAASGFLSQMARLGAHQHVHDEAPKRGKGQLVAFELPTFLCPLATSLRLPKTRVPCTVSDVG